jgi:preprotein translocase subunit SecE
MAESKLVAYINSAKEELKKVSWPTRKQTVKYTIIVILFSLGVALFLGLLDAIFSFGMARLIIK